MQRWIVLTALTSALTGLAAPAQAADPARAQAPVRHSVRDSAGTVVTLGDAMIDPKVPGRVRVNVGYLCSVADEARSLTVSVEQADPEDAASKAFGSSRTAEADIVCDGTQQERQLIVQSKTSNWIPDVDAVLIATVSNIGASPSASADSRRVSLKVG
ncbi:hypothetical protein [Streptomyces sp. CBMA123]|uniref:hypothetical protein n=1 Tax=Streptomyces sp. CBMA123 TaxID=1896313 RepID=UPI001661C167|nr:hypothetical protein [Streptomyces sp. CBMA123]MBD0689857.1 hypothetical protein [Streptomyces sp. CBMA123]